jgi:hypothetical protein
MCDPQSLTTLWASMAYYRDSFTFIRINEGFFLAFEGEVSDKVWRVDVF